MKCTKEQSTLSLSSNQEISYSLVQSTVMHFQLSLWLLTDFWLAPSHTWEQWKKHRFNHAEMLHQLINANLTLEAPVVLLKSFIVFSVNFRHYDSYPFIFLSTLQHFFFHSLSTPLCLVIPSAKNRKWRLNELIQAWYPTIRPLLGLNALHLLFERQGLCYSRLFAKQWKELFSVQSFLIWMPQRGIIEICFRTSELDKPERQASRRLHNGQKLLCTEAHPISPLSNSNQNT